MVSHFYLFILAYLFIFSCIQSRLTQTPLYSIKHTVYNITFSVTDVEPVEDTDDECLLDAQVQLLIQESCQAHHRTRPSSDLVALQELCENPEAFSQVDSRGWYPLHWAAVQPVVEVLEMVLYASCRLTLEETTVEGETFLTSAVNAGLVDNVKMLLKHGAAGMTVRSGSRKLVSTVLNGGARVGQVCLKKWTAMHEAAMTGYAHIMELLLSNGGKVTDTDQHGVTPLGIAAEYSHAEVLEVLIKHGADVNAQAPNGDSVLYDATGSGNPDCVNILLEHGANPNMHNLSFQLPIHKAAYEGHYLALRTLMPLTTRRALRLAGQSPVHSAADGGHAHCLELLLQSGYDVNALLAPHVSENYGDMRQSPLYFAVSNGDRTCTELLLNSGAQPDLDPLSCLLVAVRSGRYEIVKLLLEAKADVNCYFTAVTDTVFPTALLYWLNQGLDAKKCFCCSHDDSWDDHMEYMPSWSSSITHEHRFCDFVGLSWLVNLAGRVVSILLEYVGQVSLCNKLIKILENQKEWSQIQEIISNPRPLSHLCRVAIRKHQGCHSIMSLKAPNRIKDYLLFKENDLYGKVICGEK
uniref:SOCS box domain-containing protein n=1 Tax=Periophthalmus magnuspinnatus TaxID=409849 RepID=A0A3B4AFE6_9GOBI